MKNKLTFLFALPMTLVLFFFAVSCDTPKSDNKATFDLTKAKMEIEKANRTFMENLRKGDSVSLSKGYTQNAKFMIPNSPAVAGRPGIQSVFASFINSGATNIDLKSTEVWGNEDLITEEGTYTLATADGAQLDKGKYMVLWKKEDGNWKLFRDIFNSDMPVPTDK